MSKLLTLVVTSDNSATRVDVVNDDSTLYNFLSGTVGGTICHVKLRSDLDFWCNDDGISLGLPLNVIASSLYGSSIYGDVVFMGGLGESGESLSLGSNHASAIELLSAMA